MMNATEAAASLRFPCAILISSHWLLYHRWFGACSDEWLCSRKDRDTAPRRIAGSSGERRTENKPSVCEGLLLLLLPYTRPIVRGGHFSVVHKSCARAVRTGGDVRLSHLVLFDNSAGRSPAVVPCYSMGLSLHGHERVQTSPPTLALECTPLRSVAESSYGRARRGSRSLMGATSFLSQLCMLFLSVHLAAFVRARKLTWIGLAKRGSRAGWRWYRDAAGVVHEGRNTEVTLRDIQLVNRCSFTLSVPLQVGAGRSGTECHSVKELGICPSSNEQWGQRGPIASV